MAAAAAAAPASASTPASTPSASAASFLLPLPPPQPREHALWRYFQRLLSGPDAASLRSLAVLRSPFKGRYLATGARYEPGQLILSEKAILSVSDDPDVCLACGVRHQAAGAAAAPKCPRFQSLFGSMRLALASVSSISEQTDYPSSRLREVLKFVAITYEATYAPERVPAGGKRRSEAERKEACEAWLFTGLDDGSSTVETTDPHTGAPTFTTTLRASDAHRTLTAQLLHSSLPLTYRKHYPPALLEQVMSVLELNAHETLETVPAANSSASPSTTAAAAAESVVAGDAMFPFFTMIESSCIENCCWTASHNNVRVTALRTIAPAAASTPAANAGAPSATATAASASSSGHSGGVMNFSFHTAIVRGLSPAFSRALQMAPSASPINVDLATAQHSAYTELLRRVLPGGVVEVPGSEQFPDCNFVEDTAILMGDVAVLSRPGAPERLGEEEAVAVELAKMPFRRLERIQAPGTMDGGDILYTGRHLFVGESKRTNAATTAQLQSLLAHDPLVHFTVHPIPVLAGLHLKSLVSILADGVLVLADPAFDGGAAAQAVRSAIESVDPSYHFVLVPDLPSCNVLRVRETLLVQAGFSRSESILREAAEKHGLQVATLEMSELIKADGALTCGSLTVGPLPSTAPVAADSLTALSINYGPTFLPTRKRRAYLQEAYGFHCVCPLCEGASSGLHDLARAFRCTQPAPAAAATSATGKGSAAAAAAAATATCSGMICPKGEATAAAPGVWSCTRCSFVPPASLVTSFLAAEDLILSSLLSLPPAVAAAVSMRDAVPLGAGEDVFDRMAGDADLAAVMEPRLEQMWHAVVREGDYAGEMRWAGGGNGKGVAPALASASSSSSSSSSAATSSASSSSSSKSSSSLGVSPSPAKTARKNARVRKAASKRAMASGTGASFFVLSPSEREAVGLLHANHWVAHHAAELLLNRRMEALLAAPEGEVTPQQWAAVLPYALARVASIRTVLRAPNHWSLAREFDRIGVLHTLTGRAREAKEAWQEAYQVHRACFGEEADCTRRALRRAQHPPTTRKELGLEQEDAEDDTE